MKPFRLLLVLITLALALSFLFAAPSARAAAKTPPPPPDVRKLIKSVDVAAGTIVIQYMRDKRLRTYSLDDVTTITLNNSPGKIADIKPGMEMTDYVERDDHTLDSITLQGFGTPPPAAKAPPQKKAP